MVNNVIVYDNMLNKISDTEYNEMIAYESLSSLPKTTEKKLYELFKDHNFCKPSSLLNNVSGIFGEYKNDVLVKYINDIDFDFKVIFNKSDSYPTRLRDAKYPVELLYYKGNKQLLNTKCISIVGSRKASPEGLLRARKMARLLVNEGYTIVSGLASGIDTAALHEAVKIGGNVIAVIGTPINEYYPKENKELQDYISKNHLLISQVPFYKYHIEHFKEHRIRFPQRNSTMSALSLGTVVIEAGDTSGTLTQARACLNQGRRLFILKSCFENKSITWPSTYLKKGAIKVNEIEDLLGVLND